MILPPDVQSVIDDAVSAYFDDCRVRIDGFIKQHFRFPGAWHTNRCALGWDLLRAPFNLFWAPVYVVSVLLGWTFQQLGWDQLGNRLRRLPDGFTTSVQIGISELVQKELLRLGSMERTEPIQASIPDAFDDLIEPEIHNEELLQELKPVIAKALTQYGLTRTASADITNSILSTVLGAFAFQKFAPGGVAVGLLFGTWLAQQQAVDSFLLGEFLGNLYYGLFPAEPSPGMRLTGIAVTLFCLAVFASLSGLITDPIQSWIGLHKLRLNKLVNSLQSDFEARSHNTFHPKDPYVARILEIIDAAKSQL